MNPTVLVAGFSGALGARLHQVAHDGKFQVFRCDEGNGIAPMMAEHQPRVALINKSALPSVIQLRRLVLAHPETGVVVGFVNQSALSEESLLAAGARVVVPIDLGDRELCGVLGLVARRLVGPPPRRRRGTASGIGLLTTRELQVLERLAQWRSAREIADALEVTVATVNTHRRHIYEKLGIHSRRDLALAANELKTVKTQ